MSLLEENEPMTVEAFLAFTESQLGDERWELIDGVPVMNPSPTFNHQKIVLNLLYELETLRRQGRDWDVVPGIGVKLSKTNMPVPDVLIRPGQHMSGYFCDDMIVAFEVLSPSSRSTDLRWKRNAYPKLPSLAHYVVLAQDDVTVRCYDRSTDWAERRLGRHDGLLELSTLGIELHVPALYAGTGL